MNKSIKYVFSLIAGLILLSGTAIAGEGHKHFSGDPLKAMAQIVSGLKHFPSDSEKKQLNDIISHSDDASIKAIATALVNMRHSVKDDDKTQLTNIINNANAVSSHQILAKIIRDINHKPTSADKNKLAAIIGS